MSHPCARRGERVEVDAPLASDGWCGLISTPRVMRLCGMAGALCWVADSGYAGVVVELGEVLRVVWEVAWFRNVVLSSAHARCMRTHSELSQDMENRVYGQG
jgi:hypothetical protein